MAKILHFYEELTSIFGRVFKKVEVDAFTDEQFLNLSIEKKSRIRELVNGVMADRNKLFPVGYGADSVDVSLLPDAELPLWSSLVLDTDSVGTRPAAVPPMSELASGELSKRRRTAGRHYGSDGLVVHHVRQERSAYGPGAFNFGAFAFQLLQEGNRLFSDPNKRRYHARLVSRKKAAFIKELNVFLGRAGPDLDKLSPDLAVAMRALIQQVESKTAGKPVVGASIEALRPNWRPLSHAKGPEKNSVQR